MLSLAELKYRLVDQLGRPDFCDPDTHPVAVGDEGAAAREHFPQIRADIATYDAISARLGVEPIDDPDPEQLLAVYREWKMLNALVLEPVDDGHTFDYIAVARPGDMEQWRVRGTIDAAGVVAIGGREPSGPPPCPICLAGGTTIDAPGGPIPIEALRVGMTVWTTDRSGHRVATTVLELGSSPAPSDHRIVRLVLDDGRTVDVSPGHPTADGRPVGDLRTGDMLDGARVVSALLLAYDGGHTFDLLPGGETGAYWANGILLGSTLAERR